MKHVHLHVFEKKLCIKNKVRSIREAKMAIEFKAIPNSRFHFSVSRTAVKLNLKSSPNAEAHRRKIFGPSFVVGITHGLSDTNKTEKAGILLTSPCLGNTMKMHLNPGKTEQIFDGT